MDDVKVIARTPVENFGIAIGNGKGDPGPAPFFDDECIPLNGIAKKAYESFYV